MGQQMEFKCDAPILQLVLLMDKCRKVELYLDGKHYVVEFEQERTLRELTEHLKNSQEFINRLQENGKPKLPVDAVLSYKYNSMDGQPSLETLKLRQFHPKKKLIFYVGVQSNTQSSLPIDSGSVKYPDLSSGSVKHPTLQESSGLIIPPAESLSAGDSKKQETAKQKIDPDIITIVLNNKLLTSNNRIPISRMSTFSKLFDAAGIAKEASLKVICKVGGKETSYNYAQVETETLKKVFGDLPSGEVTIEKVYVAGRC